MPQLVNQWTVDIHALEHHLAIKGNNLLILTVTWWITNALQNSNAKWKKLASTGYWLYDSTYVTIWKRSNCKGQRSDQCFPDPRSVGRCWWWQAMRGFFGSFDMLLQCCAQSCLTLCNRMDCSLLDPSVHGILQARILGQVAMPSSRESSNPGIEPMSLFSCIVRGILLPRYHMGSLLGVMWLFPILIVMVVAGL